MTATFVRLLTACVLLGAGFEARAQVTIHKMDLTLKTVRQVADGFDTKAAKQTVKSPDIFEICFDFDPGSDYGIYAIFECDALNENNISGYYEVNGSGKAIGSFTFDGDAAVTTTTSGGTVVKSVTLPFELEIDCGSSGEVTARGIADITLKNVDGLDCADTIKAKLTGVGAFEDMGPVIVDEGSSMSIKKPITPPVPVP